MKGGRDFKGFKEGRLEVRLANSFTWGVICGDHWDLRAAIVACRHFNAGYARQAQKVKLFLAVFLFSNSLFLYRICSFMVVNMNNMTSGRWRYKVSKYVLPLFYDEIQFDIMYAW